MPALGVMTGVEAAKAAVPTSGGPPLPPPPPPGGTISVTNTDLVLATTPTGKTNTRLGMTSVHNETRNSTTKAVIAGAAAIQNQHLLGFGSATNPQPGAGAAYVWTFMDSTFGYPTASSGYFSGAAERCVTLCGCPPHMRSPKAGQTWDPMGARTGTQLTSLSDYSPPHSSWFQEYADLCAAFAARYPHVKYFQVWNELKGLYFSTQYGGSNLVPTGSGLPLQTGTSNRWWSEGYTYLYNKIWAAIKAVRPDAVIVGPYAVMNSFGWDQSTDWANDPFPNDLQGAWGYADKKVLANAMYFIKNCTGVDMFCMDIRNYTKDISSGGYYNPATLPAAPDLANKWLTNPEGGTHHLFWKEGQVLGSWNSCQKQTAFINWLRALGASSSVYQRPQADARTLPVCWAEWYAYGPYPEFHTVADPRTGVLWVETNSHHPEEAAAMAWHYMESIENGTYYSMMWKPEGTIQGGMNDPGDSNPLALWYQNGQAGSLTATELRAPMVGMVANFPPGTQLKQLTNTVPEVRALASATKLLVVNRAFVPVSFSWVDVNNPTPTPVTLAANEVRFITR